MDLPKVAELTLEQKVGQLFMLAFAGPTANDAAGLIRQFYLGACYLSNDNFTDPRQAALLAGELQALARESSGIPLILAADQEGAWAVLTPHSCPGPGNMGLGATGAPEDVHAMYKVFGQELRAVGLNVDLAPDADVNSNPRNPIIGMRSFGEDPEMVARHVRAAIAGLHEAGVLAAAKHFPGHGDTAADTHRGLARVDQARLVLDHREFVPFRAAIDAGVDIVMTAHILFPALDPERPATLSPQILQALLRDAMGFEGVILTDSFNMGAIRRAHDPVSAVVQTVRAGADMILLAEERYGDEFKQYLAGQARLVEGLTAAARDGQLPLARIDDAVSRVLALKTRLKPAQPVDPKIAIEAVGSTANRAVERRVAEDAVVLVQNRGGLVPLAPARAGRLVVVSVDDTEGYRRMAAGRGIGPNVIEHPPDVAFTEIRRRRPDATLLSLSGDEGQATAPELSHAGVIVVVTEQFPLAGFDFPEETQHRVIRWLLMRRFAPVVVLACRAPYELANFPEVDAYICAMGYRPASVAAAVQVLFGEIRPRGRLPVSVPDLYTVGHHAS